MASSSRKKAVPRLRPSPRRTRAAKASARTSDAKARLEELEVVFSALAHPARRQMLLTVHLRGGAMTAGEIAGRFAHAWPTTTRHLQVLEAAGLLESGRKGRTRVYAIAHDRLDVLRTWLSWFEREAPAAPAQRRRPT